MIFLFLKQESGKDLLRALFRAGFSSGTGRAARGRAGRRKACFSTARPRATARRQTNPAAEWRSRPEMEGVRARLVHQQPALDLDEVAVGGVRKAADAVGADHAVAGNDDRQLVVAAGLAH